MFCCPLHTRRTASKATCRCHKKTWRPHSYRLITELSPSIALHFRNFDKYNEYGLSVPSWRGKAIANFRPIRCGSWLIFRLSIPFVGWVGGPNFGTERHNINQAHLNDRWLNRRKYSSPKQHTHVCGLKNYRCALHTSSESFKTGSSCWTVLKGTFIIINVIKFECITDT